MSSKIQRFVRVLGRTGLFAVSLLLLVQLTSAETFQYVPDPNNPTIKRIEKTYVISLDTKNDTEKLKTIDFKNYNFPPPPECNSPRVTCTEKGTIVMTVKKEWVIEETVPALTNPELTCDQFKSFYPALPENTTITDASPLEQKLIAQYILHFRGLLPVSPTGKIGLWTEMGIIRLGHIKGCHDFNPEKGIAEIGTCMIQQLNGLRDRMCETNYIESHPLPPFNSNELEGNIKRRWNNIMSGLKTAKLTPGLSATLKLYQSQADQIPVTNAKPDSATSIEGSAKIEHE